jgi:hypothetical protein
MDLMGIVIAHELGHLLLPDGMHGQTGLMRAVLPLEDLRSPGFEPFAFTETQAHDIRSMLGNRRREEWGGRRLAQ